MNTFISSADMHFHAGECDVQARALGGTAQRARLTAIGRMAIRDAMPDQHRGFFTQLPFVVLGSVDDTGQPWASVLAGPPGFVQSPGATQLQVASLPSPTDPLHNRLRPGASVGLLGIEPHTRRRNRANGVVGAVNGTGFAVQVRQSFGNCPKYIQARSAAFVPGGATPTQVSAGPRLDVASQALVTAADTFFIATAHPESAQGEDSAAMHGVDVSHRGGKPGFVRLDRLTTHDELTVPDFTGNQFFNTLGNLAVQPQAGLLFIDFERGDVLYLAVTVRIVWDGPELASFEGALRLLKCEVLSARRVAQALPLRWGTAQLSPVLAETGAWG
jgi:uncharacterized protein